MGNCLSLKGHKHKQLYSASYEHTPKHSLTGRSFEAVIVDCYDGDTCVAAFKAYDKIELFHCRLDGIDTPEMTGNTKKKALDARDLFVSMISTQRLTKRDATRKEVREHLRQYKKLVTIHCKDNDKYGRVLTTLYDGDSNINASLVLSGVAKPYHGGTKESFEVG